MIPPLVRPLAILALLFASPSCNRSESITGPPLSAVQTIALRDYLRRTVEAKGVDAGIVVGFIDERGRQIVSYGKAEESRPIDVDGDTIFEIGSGGKTFTAILLQDMVERGEVKLDVPVRLYLPVSVKMPTRGGKEITLRHLATHFSGLPAMPSNLDPKRADNPYANFTVEKLYAFLSGYQLTRDPGESSEYSNLAVGLLGHTLAHRAGESYEALVIERICRPLGMESTRITLTPEQKMRLVTPHNGVGEATPAWDLPTLAGAGGLRSTANDLLKYVSANLGLTLSPLTPIMAKTHQTPLTWNVQRDGRNVNLVWHGGGTGGCRSMAMFDKRHRRGVVMLTNSVGIIDGEAVCRLLIGCDWRSDVAIEWPPIPPAPVERISTVKLDSKQLDAIVGRYVFSPDAISPNGFDLTIWREGDQLMGQARGEKVVQGAFEVFPESVTTFFLRINHARLIFDEGDKQEIIAVTHRLAGYSDVSGKREPWHAAP